MRATLIIIFIFPTIILHVKCLDSNNETSNKSDHKMSIAWSLHPIIGIVGTFLNRETEHDQLDQPPDPA